jgi:hypothetical protein
MINQNNNSIVAALFARAISLDKSLNSLARFILAFEPPETCFSRLRMEVVARKRNDAWDAYRNASKRMGLWEQTYTQDDSHVLDYVINRLAQ